ncbi:MAG: hypothetical protein DRR19_09410 [Candidatus Parabeggiatoa sp. nov. 1]|nr:MAG: hypothetical protein DRR19_09410 [Gammaproteobacteria bacterium]
MGKVFFLPTITIIRYFWWAKKTLAGPLQKLIDKHRQLFKAPKSVAVINFHKPQRIASLRRDTIREVHFTDAIPS